MASHSAFHGMLSAQPGLDINVAVHCLCLAACAPVVYRYHQDVWEV